MKYGNRNLNRDSLSPIIVSNDPDGIAEYFCNLVDWLFFGSGDDGDQIPVPPPNFSEAVDIDPKDLLNDWPGWLPLITNLLDLFDPDECPSEFLPHLSRMCGISTQLFHVEKDLDERAKRQLIKDSVPYSRTKGVSRSVFVFFRAIGWKTRVENLWLDLRTVGIDPPLGKSDAKAWPLPADPEPEQGYYFNPAFLMPGTGPNFQDPPTSDPWWRPVNQIDVTYKRTLDGQEPVTDLEALIKLLTYIVPIYILIRGHNIGEYMEDEFDFSWLSDDFHPIEIDYNPWDLVIPYDPENGMKEFLVPYHNKETSLWLDRSGTVLDEWGYPYTRKGYTLRQYPIPYTEVRPQVLRDGITIPDRTGTHLDQHGIPYYHIPYPELNYSGCDRPAIRYYLRDLLNISAGIPKALDWIQPWIVPRDDSLTGWSPPRDGLTHVRQFRADIRRDINPETGNPFIEDRSGNFLSDWGVPFYHNNGQLTPYDASKITVINSNPLISEHEYYVLDDDKTRIGWDIPLIDLFTAVPDLIIRHDPSLLTWETTNALVVEIDNGVGIVPVDGSTNVYPLVSTTYILTATGLGVATDSVIVDVTPNILWYWAFGTDQYLPDSNDQEVWAFSDPDENW